MWRVEREAAFTPERREVIAILPSGRTVAGKWPPRRDGSAEVNGGDYEVGPRRFTILTTTPGRSPSPAPAMWKNEGASNNG